LRNAGIRILSALLLIAACAACAPAQISDSLDARIQKVMARPEFTRSNFGIEFYDLETSKVIYALNADKMFVPASTTKLLTEGTVLAKLDPIIVFTPASIAPVRSTRRAR